MKKYIVQYVGFMTTTDKDSFIHRWTPFANQYKALGVEAIDLYHVTQGQDLSFLSRNVWDSESYMRNFPTGLAGAGGGGGIKIKQMGAYWLKPDQLACADEMKLIFLDRLVEMDDPLVASRLRVKPIIAYPQMLDFAPRHPATVAWPFHAFICKHLQRM